MIGWSLGEFAHGIRVMKQVGGAADAPVEPAEFALASVGYQMVSETMSKHVTAREAMRELLSALSACQHTHTHRSLGTTDLVTIDFIPPVITAHGPLLLSSSPMLATSLTHTNRHTHLSTC